jgi:hypothetical protein
MADYRLGLLQADIGIVFGCMRPLVKDHSCAAGVLVRISSRADCCKIASLTMSARVKRYSSARLHALKEERHFALLDGVAFPTVGSLVIVCQARNSVRPMHLFGPNFDHDYYFELPRKRGAGSPNQLLGDRLHTIAISGLSRVRTELFPLLVIPSLAPHPIQTNRQLPGHGDLRDFPGNCCGTAQSIPTSSAAPSILGISPVAKPPALPYE